MPLEELLLSDGLHRQRRLDAQEHMLSGPDLDWEAAYLPGEL